MKRRLGRQLPRHEAQLDKRTDAIRQQTVVDLVDVGKVVARPPRIVLVVEAHLVVEDGVEPHVLDARCRLDLSQIVPVTLAQRQDGASGPEHAFPEVGKTV